MGLVACGAAEWAGEQTARGRVGDPLIQACVRTRVYTEALRQSRDADHTASEDKLAVSLNVEKQNARCQEPVGSLGTAVLCCQPG